MMVDMTKNYATKWRPIMLGLVYKREMKLPWRNLMKIRTKAPNFALTKDLNENTNKSTKFWLKVWQDWALAKEYDVDVDVDVDCYS
jgi:hypothetical protein